MAGGICIAVTSCVKDGCSSQDMESQCVDRICVINTMKDAYQLDSGLPDGSPVSWKDIAPYVEEGKTNRFKCLRGGEIRLNAMGESAECSMHVQIRAARGQPAQ